MSTVHDEPKPDGTATSEAEPAPPSDPLDPDVIVRVWREGELLRAGYPQATAEEFAARPLTIDGSGVCLGRARELVAAGCPIDLAERILR